MKDTYQREIDYMRISITDRCNLRCTYCMPEGIRTLPMKEILTYEEIVRVCEEAAALGIRKIKITGGEPLVRKGCACLIRMIKGVPGIEQVTLTTNGVLLAEAAEELKDAGIDGVNVSLDTMDAKRFLAITGADRISQVLRGIERALALGIRVKTNTVLQPGLNENAWRELLALAKEQPVAVRFIEMMPIGAGQGIASVSNGEILENIRQEYGQVTQDDISHGNGPAVYYRVEGLRGSVGFISAVHGKFCHSCNRIRMTAEGLLKPCLCYGEGISIKEALRNGNEEDVRECLRQAILRKPEAHCFGETAEITEKREMSRIGG